MHVKYKLRKPTGHIIPKGPDFKWARKIKTSIDGTVIRFRAPKHRPMQSNNIPTLPKRKYQMDSTPLLSYGDELINGVKWRQTDLYNHEWAFYGPWFTGVQSALELHVILMKPESPKYEGASLFHPRAFEMAIGDYLSYLFSKNIDDETGKQHFIAPVDWTPLNNLPVVEARLRVIPDEEVALRTIRHLAFFPITDSLLICVHFMPRQLGRGSQEERDKRVSRDPMYELVDNIINSIELTLSPEAKAQQKKALAELEDTSLIKDYPPLQWSKTKQDNELKELGNP